MRLIVWWILVQPLFAADFLDRIDSSVESTDKILHSIHSRWEINQFPNFLNSGYMSVRSWSYLRTKFQQKLLSTALSTGQRNFTIVFTGSSVTSGQDSDYSQSFPVLVESFMGPAFSAGNINLVVRNVAFGNNPCLPYDVCVRTFAGDDADIIVWEQSYNCLLERDMEMQEQFIRQSKFIPSKPVVVISSSDTPNWPAEDCALTEGSYTPTAVERALLLRANAAKDGMKDIITIVNRDIIKIWGRNILTLAARYPNVAIEMFRHDQYSAYKCHGPYVKNWSSGNAPWHPSVLGHAVRAAHYTFVWLQVWRSALVDLRSRFHGSTVVAMPTLEKMNKENSLIIYPYLDTALPSAVWPSDIPDNAQCFTSFSPRSKEEMSLSALVASGLEAPNSGPENPGWSYIVFESLMDSEYLPMSDMRGYLDRKITLVGNDLSGVLKLHLHLQHNGKILLCEPPAVWGEYPASIVHLWDKDNVDIKILSDTPFFTFGFGKRNKVEHFESVHAHESVCIVSKKLYQKGKYILALRARSEKHVLLSTIILP